MKKIFTLTVLALALCACEENLTPEGKDPGVIRGTAPAFHFGEAAAKTSLIYNSSGLSFFWSGEDRVAVFGSTGQNAQIPLIMDDVSGEQVKTATYTISVDYLLRKGSSYIAYCPVLDESIFLTAKKVPFNYAGQVQESNGTGSTSHLGAYDFMSTDPTEAADDNVAEFNFHHRCCPVLLSVGGLPADKYVSVSLKASEAVFPISGTMNLFENTITAKTVSDRITVTLKDGFTLGEGEELNAWVMTAPAPLAGKTVTVVVTPESGSPIELAVNPKSVKDFTEGKAYRFRVEIPKELEVVDLELPSGTRWASMNLGATSVEDFGDYFAWGETSTKESFTANNYKFYPEGTSGSCSKYCGGYKGKDELTELEVCDDAASAALGSEWRIPSTADWKELLDNCTIEDEEINGVKMYRIIGGNGTVLLLPRNGYYSIQTHNSEGSALYWTRDNPTTGMGAFTQATAVNIGFAGGKVTASLTGKTRYFGLGIRPISKK